MCAKLPVSTSAKFWASASVSFAASASSTAPAVALHTWAPSAGSMAILEGGVKWYQTCIGREFVPLDWGRYCLCSWLSVVLRLDCVGQFVLYNYIQCMILLMPPSHALAVLTSAETGSRQKSKTNRARIIR
ncbi:hypothetical protein BAUCODRAFT_437996 [Baudoinia panamericana UAMH 10762]|uniref:Uncharacterized protein n=1 Tax=Baudoinia panamericana (strain UAMH 10762) TaxID=717646 RepID=M2MK76_BAUPA|nr:uncharacterized protein BAUCODRAFT_437996 [Baudoinia panamericana UAMH 10762]EMC97091.1 hypothetical protein BAUCODRAFT_437996 [Baudoinia panamericana UAMH 10762]